MQTVVASSGDGMGLVYMFVAVFGVAILAKAKAEVILGILGLAVVASAGLEAVLGFIAGNKQAIGIGVVLVVACMRFNRKERKQL